MTFNKLEFISLRHNCHRRDIHDIRKQFSAHIEHIDQADF